MTKELRELNGKSVILGDLIDAIKNSGFNAYIPEYQRNYKWNAQGTISAAKLLADLLDQYNICKNENKSDTNKSDTNKSVGLVTLYIDEKNKKIHILDGQQRLVTLMLIFTALGKSGEFFPVEYQRDEGLSDRTRKQYIESLDYTENFVPERLGVALSDKRRFQYNYNQIYNGIPKELNKEVFVDFIKAHTCFLLHVSEIEPVEEFLNLNCYKTKFSVCDRVRSKLIVYASFHREEVKESEILRYILQEKKYKTAISCLFEDLSQLLYDNDDNRIFNLVTRKEDRDLIKTTNENRINILFKELVIDTTNGYMGDIKTHLIDGHEIDWLVKLSFYLYRLKELKADIDNGDHTLENEIKCLKERVDKFDFFKMLDDNIDKYKNQSSTNKILGQILHTTSSLDKLLFEYSRKSLSGKDALVCNTMFHVLSNTKEQDNVELSSVVKDCYISSNKDKENFITMNVPAFEDTVQTSGKYMLYRYFNRQAVIKNTLLHFPYDEILVDDDPDQRSESGSQSSVMTEGESDFPEKISVEELMEYEIFIPVVQRDYCLGAHLSVDENENNLLSYLVGCCENNSYPTLSAVTVRRSRKSDNRIYLYDGQQRVVTIALLLKILGYEKKIEIAFEGRKNFQEFFNGVSCINEGEGTSEGRKSASYARSAVDNLKEVLKNLKVGDEEFRNFVLNINFDVVNIAGTVSTAEQYFMDINDGVQLKPYEIFKCKLNTKVKDLYRMEQDKNIRWINLVENDLVDRFYCLKRIKFDNEGAVHEVAAMQLLEYFLRMMYNEAEIAEIQELDKVWKILSKKSFCEENDIGDIDKFINILMHNNMELLFEITNSLTKDMLSIQKNFDEKEDDITVPKSDEMQECGEYKFVQLQYKFDPDFFDDVVRKNFLDDLGSFCAAQDTFEYFGSRQFDIVMWTVIKKLYGANKEIDVKAVVDSWSESVVYEPTVFLAPGFIGIYKEIVLPVQYYYVGDKEYRKYYFGGDMRENKTNLPAFIYQIAEKDISANCKNAISSIFRCNKKYISGSDGKYEIFYRHFQSQYGLIRKFDKIDEPEKNIKFADDGQSVIVKDNVWYTYFEKRGDSGKGFKKPILWFPF